MPRSTVAALIRWTLKSPPNELSEIAEPERVDPRFDRGRVVPRSAASKWRVVLLGKQVQALTVSPWDRGGISEGLKGLNIQDLSNSRGPRLGERWPSSGFPLVDSYQRESGCSLILRETLRFNIWGRTSRRGHWRRKELYRRENSSKVAARRFAFRNRTVSDSVHPLYYRLFFL